MKRLILFLALFLDSPFTWAVNYTVTACSFVDSSVVQYNSAQWIDVKVSGSYTSSDRIKIHLTQMIGSVTISSYTPIFDQSFYSYFLNLPQQANGSRRAYFNMPASYPTGKFQLSIYGELYSLRYGFFTITTDIQSYGREIDIIKTNYYDLYGKQLEDEPDAGTVHITENFYSNGSYKRKKSIKQ